MLAVCVGYLFLITFVSAHDFDEPVVTTQRYDNARTGQNQSETILNTSNVSLTTFGKIFTRAVDDQVYAQPLYVPKVTGPYGVRNVLYVATASGTVYAFDADDPSAATPLWRARLASGPPGMRPVTNIDVGEGCLDERGGRSYRDFSGNLGIVGTPVIDLTSQTLYVVSRTRENDKFVQRLHALDIATGTQRSKSPIVIKASVPGTGSGSSNGVIVFNPRIQNQRGALLLANGVVYITWAAHCDLGPYHGWIMGYDQTTLTQVLAKITTPSGKGGGIWQSGTGPSADAWGNLYFTVGNGTVTAPSGGQDFGNALLKLSSAGEVLDWFIPFDNEARNFVDLDLGSSGVLLIPNSNLLASGGKEGTLFMLDRNNFGKFQSGSNSQIVQSFFAGGYFFGTPTYWDGPGGPYVYTWCGWDRARQFRLEGNLLTTTPTSQSTMEAGRPGGILSISANGRLAGTGILWAAVGLSDAMESTVPGILRAFDAADLSHELWNSRQNTARDDFGTFAKFNTPVVANGKVYLASFSQQVAVYGLLPPDDAPPTVNAGPDQTIVLPNLATLVGTASDDRLPPNALTTTWVQVSGIGEAIFATPHSLTSTVRFSAPGTYILRLTASDGALSADSTITIRVLPPGWSIFRRVREFLKR
jgi:hypothetical protein